MNYQQLTLKTNKENANFIEEIAFGLGALSVDFSDSFDTPILEPKLGTTPLWNDITLKILFVENVDKNAVLNSLQEICNISGEFEFITDKNWQAECNKNFTTTKYGDNLWICPSWENCANLSGEVIKMDPGMAFGTGSHQTTSLCLEYLANNPPVGQGVLDFGCGSGILAIAAKKLDATSVMAVDNDAQAIIATDNNTQQNSVNITTILAENLTNLGNFDLIIANVLTPVLVGFASDFAKHLNSGGKVILSGILDNQESEIYQAFTPYFTNLTTYKKDQWLLIVADVI
jgi:ribosomal protein L11 methyltransferase